MNLQALANLLGGRVEHNAVRIDRKDGMVAVLRPGGGWVYEDVAAHVRWNRDGDDSGLLKAEEWGDDAPHGRWVKEVALILGAGWHHTGGNCCIVLFERADGKFAIFNEEGGMLFDSRESWDAKHASGDDEVGDDGVAWHSFE